MPTKDFKLTIQRREKLGTTGAQGLRAKGKIPAVLYGHGIAAEHLALDAHAFEEVLHHGGRNSIITLNDGGKKGETALVRDVQVHPVSHRVLHADLLRVSADEAVSASIGIVTVGVPKGVKDFGGVMDVLVHELEIEGPASRIPDHLEIDVTELGIHEHATAGDIKLPDGFTLLIPADTVVVAIEQSRTERELEEAAAGPTEAVEPEIVGAEPTAQTAE